MYLLHDDIVEGQLGSALKMPASLIIQKIFENHLKEGSF